MLASIALVIADHRYHHLETFRAALSVAVYPLQFLVDLPVETGRWARESLAFRRHLLEENQHLRDQHLLYEARLQRMAALEAENIRLRALFGSSPKQGERLLIAELLAVDLDPYKHQIVLNKGSRQGVYLGQPLLDAQGVMGQVIHVGLLSATAMLVTDPSHAVPVQVNRNGLRSVAVGTGALNRLELPHIPNNADIRKGDLLVTSGLGGRFPPGYPVATVIEVIHDPGRPFAHVNAQPMANLDRSHELLLTWPAETPTTHTPETEAPEDAP